MKITLQYFAGCPNWETTDRHLTTLIAEGLDASIDYEMIDNYETAAQRGFRGSPTVLIDGTDPFAGRNLPVGLACRIYVTEEGPAGSSTLGQLRHELTTMERG